MTRIGAVALDNRLVVVAVSRGRVESFTVDSAEPASALRAELEARRLRPRSVAVGLPRGSAVVKPIDLPEVGGELADMVRFELDRHLPFPAEDAAFDFVPLSAPRGTPGGNGRRVLVTAADRRVIDAALRVLHGASLRPTSITVASHDLVALARPPRGRRIVWVHYTGGDADLLFLSGPTLVLSRQVAAGTEADVTAEIRRSLALVRWRGCDAVWVSGDAAAPHGPSRGALSDLGAPVTEPPYTPRARRLVGELPSDGRGAYALALAVASGRRVRSLDLIPLALKPRRITRAQLLTAANVAAAAVLVVAALLVTGYRDQQRLAAVNADIARLEPEVRAIEQVRNELERKQQLVQTITSLRAASIRPLPVLRELTDVLPADAWLTLVSVDLKGIELTGQATSASALIPLLENSPTLERVEFASPVTRGRDREQFRILAKWEGSPGAPAMASAAQRPAPPAAPASRAAPGPVPAPRRSDAGGPPADPNQPATGSRR